jgi:hypothetical protein
MLQVEAERIAFRWFWLGLSIGMFAGVFAAIVARMG